MTVKDESGLIRIFALKSLIVKSWARAGRGKKARRHSTATNIPDLFPLTKGREGVVVLLLPGHSLEQPLLSPFSKGEFLSLPDLYCIGEKVRCNTNSRRKGLLSARMQDLQPLRKTYFYRFSLGSRLFEFKEFFLDELELRCDEIRWKCFGSYIVVPHDRVVISSGIFNIVFQFLQL